MVQVDFRQTPMFDLAPQITNKQYTRFVFPPPPPSSTTTQRHHVTTRCQQPPTPTCTADRSQPRPTRTTTTTTTWQRQATNPSSTRPRSTTTPPTRAPRHHRQRLKGVGVCRRRRGNMPRCPDGDDACHHHRLQVSPYIPLPLLPFTPNAGALSLWVTWQPYHQHTPTATTTTVTTTRTSMIAATTTIISTSMTTDRPRTKTTAHKQK